jgi:glutamine---fructose-6-phosphate transaminase (isomerizing)
MCGIMGVLGLAGAPQLVRDGLTSLEYRGYDSCGVAWPNPDGTLGLARAVGPVAALPEVPAEPTTAFGHTRWATHGGVTVTNAHPHMGCDGRSAVVHNGVLLNHEQLRRDLQGRQHKFLSQTDSECLIHLWEEHQGSAAQRLHALQAALEGTYSVALYDGKENAIFVAKKRNPLWVATLGAATLFASDPVALRRHVKQAIPLEDGDHGILRAGEITLYDANGKTVQRPAQDIAHLDDRVDHAGYEHHMLKEIHETPAALNRLIATHVRQVPPFVELGAKKSLLNNIGRPLLLGAGTSFHAALLAADYVRTLAGLPASARATPEYKDELDLPEDGTLLVAISQSGETLDTLQALHRLRSHPHQTWAFTNQPHSTIGRQSDHTLALQSGVEVSVAATKTFLSQCFLGYLLALRLAAPRLGTSHLAVYARQAIQLPRAIERTLRRQSQVQDMARHLATYENLFVLAKGNLLPMAMEGALKLKEIAYQHAEAYPAGELKHGPFALLTPKTPVLFLLGADRHSSAVLNSLQEVRARGSPVFVLASDDAPDPGIAQCVRLPSIRGDLQPFVFASALHLLSYWVATLPRASRSSRNAQSPARGS